MKKSFIRLASVCAIILFVLSFNTSAAQASILPQIQINAITNLLSIFGVSSTTVNSVRTSLSNQNVDTSQELAFSIGGINIGGAVGQGLDTMSNNINQGLNTLKTNINSAGDLINTGANTLTNNVNVVTHTITTTVDSAGNVITPALNTMTDGITTGVKTLNNNLLSLPGANNSLTRGLVNGLNNATDQIGSNVKAGTNAANNAFQTVNNVSDNFTQTVNNASNFVTQQSNNVSSAILQGSIEMSNAPLNLTNSLVNGSMCSTLSFTGSLVQGAVGSNVTAVQNFLVSKGFLPTIDATGDFGVATTKAVRAFQTASGISATGAVGPLTKSAITLAGCSSGQPGTVVSGSSTNAQITFLNQPALALSYDFSQKESALTANFRLQIQATSTPLYVYQWAGVNLKNNTDLTKSYFASGALQPYTTAGTFGGMPIEPYYMTTAPATTTDAYGRTLYIIPAGQAAAFSLNAIVNPKILFAGNYTAFLYSSSLLENYGTDVNSSFSLPVPSTPSNAQVVVGEVSPYITSVTATPTSTIEVIVVSGTHLTNSVPSGVLVQNGYTNLVNSPNGTWLSFAIPTVADGLYPLQVSDSVTGMSNQITVPVNVSTIMPVSVAPTSVTSTVASSSVVVPIVSLNTGSSYPPSATTITAGQSLDLASYHFLSTSTPITITKLLFAASDEIASVQIRSSSPTVQVGNNAAIVTGLIIPVSANPSGIDVPVRVTILPTNQIQATGEKDEEVRLVGYQYTNTAGQVITVSGLAVDSTVVKLY